MNTGKKNYFKFLKSDLVSQREICFWLASVAFAKPSLIFGLAATAPNLLADGWTEGQTDGQT